MAKHLVKCLYCGEQMDVNSEEYVKPRSNRYAHKACAEKGIKIKTPEEQDLENLYSYIKQLFGYETIPAVVTKQIKQYAKEYHYTYSGMLKTLVYHYEIKHGDLSKAEGRVGIIPYQYDDAARYYYSIWLAQQQNDSIDLDEYILPTKTIHISSPEREIMKRRNNSFSFLEEE
jgi:hypothetical protein